MKILNEISREEIVKKFGNHRDAQYFAARPFKHYYFIALTKSEYGRLLMNSSPSKPNPELEDLPFLEESVAEYLKSPELLTKTHADRGISGTVVAKYLNKFQDGMELEDCFVCDKEGTMRPEGSFYICEGMHRLNAYGVYKNMNVKDFEIKVWYITNHERT